MPLPTLHVLPTIPATSLFVPEPIHTATQITIEPPAATSTATATPTISATWTPENPTATITQTIIPTITQTPTPELPLELDFDSVYALQLELRNPAEDALMQYRHLLPDNRLTVTAYRFVDGWAKITLLPTFIIENRWRNIEEYSHLAVVILAEQRSIYAWDAYLLHPDLPLPDVPARFMDVLTDVVPLAGEYRFPWAAGQGWWATDGWHAGNALDFQPAFESGFTVLAVESGYLTELCRDGYQSLLMIAHADGRRTYYLHVRVGNDGRKNVLDRNVQRGQVIGRLIRNAPFNYACGQGGVAHLHFIVSDRTMHIQGVALEDIARDAECCSNPPVFISTNQRFEP